MRMPLTQTVRMTSTCRGCSRAEATKTTSRSGVPRKYKYEFVTYYTNSGIFQLQRQRKSYGGAPMIFTVDKVNWETSASRLPSRHISDENHAALNQMIDDLLDLQVIQPSRATAWSRVRLVRKPTNGWRFTVDFRNLNKVISNDGWQIPNMKEMIERIGNQHGSP